MRPGNLREIIAMIFTNPSWRSRFAA